MELPRVRGFENSKAERQPEPGAARTIPAQSLWFRNQEESISGLTRDPADPNLSVLRESQCLCHEVIRIGTKSNAEGHAAAG